MEPLSLDNLDQVTGGFWYDRYVCCACGRCKHHMYKCTPCCHYTCFGHAIVETYDADRGVHGLFYYCPCCKASSTTELK